MFHCPRLAPAFLLATLASITLSQLTGCSSASKSAGSSNTNTISMSALTPATSTLQAGAQQQFAVAVTGPSDTSIIWGIADSNDQGHFSGDSTVGTISTTGLYQAPATAASLTVTIYAGAAANTSVSRTATVTVNPLPQPVSVSISPTSAPAATCPTQPCGPESTVNFSAVVSNATDTSVSWQVQKIAGGNATYGFISNSGVYAAPVNVPNPSTVAVTAIANADTTKTASAGVAISQAGGIGVSLNQSTVNLVAGGSFPFTATVSPSSTPDPAVTWSRTCAVADCGTIASTGVDSATYLAPSTVTSTLQVTITAKLDTDATKSASATVAIASPVAPSMTIAPVSPVSSKGTATLTAIFAGVDNSPTPAITWPAVGKPPTFCVSTDEEGIGGYDNCGLPDDGDDGPGHPHSAELDGPGTIVGTGGPNATYTAPTLIYKTIVQGGNLCTQATTANPAWVYVPVTATATVHGAPVTLTANTCIQLVQNDPRD